MSKYIQHFESFQNSLRKKEKTILTKIEESVIAVNDELKVKSITEIQPSLINAYIKKVKEKLGKDLTQSFSKDDIAEELTKWVISQGMTVDKISEYALLGGGPTEGTDLTPSEEIMPSEPPTETPAGEAPAAPAAEAPATPETPAAEAPATPAVNPEVKTSAESLPDGEESPETAPAVEEDEDEEKEEGEEEKEKPETELPA